MITIVCEITGCDATTAEQLLENNDWDIKKAVQKQDSITNHSVLHPLG